MKKVVKYLLLSILSILLLLVLLVSTLFIPSVTTSLTQGTLSYFLDVDANVTSARLNLEGLNVEGTLNQTDSFTLSARPESATKALVLLHYNGNVHTFSNIATVELPYIKAILDARFTTQDLYLDLNASLLEGSLKADLSLQQWNYHYTLNDLNLASYLQQQDETNSSYMMPHYVSGALHAKGSGIIEAPYTVDFALISQGLQLEHNATALISKDLTSPLPLTLQIKGDVDADDLKTTLTLQSELLDLNISNFLYDFNHSTITTTLTLNNHNQELAPIHLVALDLNANLNEENITSRYILNVDDYELHTQQLNYDYNTSDLTLDYKLSSQHAKPLNIKDDQALFGTFRYGNSNLALNIDSKVLNSPILLSIKENQLQLISNNMPLEGLQKIANQEVIAKGHLSLEADANLSSSPLLWKAHVRSKDLKLPWKYRKDIGLKNSLNLSIKAYSEKSGDIVLRPTLWSNIAIINYTALRYKPSKSLLFFNLNAKKIKTAYYKVPKLNLKGSLNLKKSRFNQTILKTSYETVVINSLSYANTNVKSKINFMVSRLDRFGRLSSSYKLHGKTTLNYTPQKTTIALDSEELGHLDFAQKNKVITLSGDTLPIQQINALLDEPTIMHGDLDYTLRYSSSSIKAMVHSDEVRGDGELNDSVRPFMLDFETSLKYNKSRYRGDATIDTGNEHFKISNIVVDLSKNQMKSRYKLNIKKLEDNTFILPPELKGPLQLSGDFEQNIYQHMTFKLTDFKLPTEWHKKLDANATTPLETNASVEVYNDKGLINFDANINNTLLTLNLHDSDYNLKTGTFNVKSELKTALWLKDTNITSKGRYTTEALNVEHATLHVAHETIGLQKLRYTFNDQNLSTEYKLSVVPYKDSPYHTKASIYGSLYTKPELYVTLKSQSLGGELDAYVTNKKLHLRADKLSMTKLIAFSGQKPPLRDGVLSATINIYSPDLMDANLSHLKGRSDITITDMYLEGIELDESLDSLRKSQDLNLFQGSFSDLPIIRSVKEIPSDITTESTHQTHIQTIRLLTDINASGLHCKDCAIATENNLIAFKGGINLEHQTFNNFYVGLLLPTNCAYFIQQVEGNVSEPQVKLAAAGFHVVGGAAKSLVGNVGTVLDFGADVLKDTGDVVGNTASYVPLVGDKTHDALTSVTDAPKSETSSMMKCTPFYTGSVKHPKRSLD